MWPSLSCMVNLFLFVCVALANAKSSYMFDDCKAHGDCASKQCCPIPGLENSNIKMQCSHNCTELLTQSKVRAVEMSEKVINGRKFKLFKSPESNWFQAFQKCCEDRGTLADLKDQKDHDDVMKFMDDSCQKRDGYGWFGGNKIGANNSVVWSTGYSKSKPEDFFPKIPHRNGGSCV